MANVVIKIGFFENFVASEPKKAITFMTGNGTIVLTSFAPVYFAIK